MRTRKFRHGLVATVVAAGALLVAAPVASADPSQQPDCPENKTCATVGSGNQISLPIDLPITLCPQTPVVKVSTGGCEVP